MSTPNNPALPPTLEWNHGVGYCGEACLVSAGMYYGQYTSQGTVRSLAGGTQVLLGDNASTAAAGLGLAIQENTESSNSQNFLNWVSSNVTSASPIPVLIGVFENKQLLGSNKPDNEYDHIVMVTGVSNSTIYLTDQGLYTDASDVPVFYFNYPFSTFPKNRTDALNNPDPYSLCIAGRNGTSNKTLHNYGLAVTGLLDTRPSLRIYLTTASSTPGAAPNEGSWEDGSSAPANINLDVTVNLLNELNSGTYNLYQYSDFAATQDEQHVATVTGPTNPGPIFSTNISSNQTIAFRLFSSDLTLTKRCRH